MNVKIHKGTASGCVFAPPSKSMAHRLLICAGLSEGISIVHGISKSEDILATLDCLSAIGAEYEIDNDTVHIKGVNPLNCEPKNILSCRESGSTLRFFIPIALLSGKEAFFIGSSYLLSRPLQVYASLCEEKELLFSQTEAGIRVRGPLPSGEYHIPGNISSQFISGLLFALVLQDGDSTIHIIPPVESGSYIDLTISALAEFGVQVIKKDEKTLFIKGNQRYQPRETSVEGDYSNAAFLSVFNHLDGNVIINGLKENSLQGDRVYFDLFERIASGTPTIDISDCPDLGPVLFALAAAKQGAVFTGTKRLKMKESDRASVMREELTKFGVAVTVNEDSVIVSPDDFHAPAETLDGHNDHRIVMALSVLLTLTGGEICGAQAVSKSFPDFFERCSDLHLNIETDSERT